MFIAAFVDVAVNSSERLEMILVMAVYALWVPSNDIILCNLQQFL